jgi:hypothetical protein
MLFQFSRKCESHAKMGQFSRNFRLRETSRKFRGNEIPLNLTGPKRKFHFRICAKIRKFSRKCKKMRENENKFSRKCQNENFRFNPSRTLTLITYSYCIKILFFLLANSRWLSLVLVRPDLSSTDSRT